MADNKDQSGAIPASQSGERKPVIIDLPSEEFGRKPAEMEGDPFTGSGDAMAPEAGGVSGPDSLSDSERARQADTDAPQPPLWADRQDTGDEPPQGTSRPDPAGDNAGAPFVPPPAQPVRSGRGGRFAALLAAALLGGAVAAGGTALLAREGYLNPPTDLRPMPPDLSAEVATLRSDLAALSQAQPAPVDVAPLQDQVAQLETAIEQLRQQSGNAATAAPALQEVQNRLTELEGAAANRPAGPPDPALEARLTELSAQVEGLRTAGGGAAEPALAGLATRIDEIAGQINDTAGLATRMDEIAARTDDLAGRLGAIEERPEVDLAPLESSIAETREQLAQLTGQIDSLPAEERVAGLETKLAGLESALNETSAQARQAEALGPAVAAGALAEALEAGAPIATELGALRALGLDPQALDTLQPYAEAGLPTLADLRASFETAAASLDLSTPVPESAGPVDRLLQSARGLVEVRPATPTQGADPGAVLARVRGALEDGDLRKALAERNALPDDAKTSTEEWARAAEARLAATDLVARLRTEALSRLGTQG